MKKNKKISKLFKILKYFLIKIYPKMKIKGMDKLPDGPCIIVGNHSQIHGPIACELFFDEGFTTWCAGQMKSIKEVPAYAYKDFWSQKPKWTLPFYKALSYIIAPLCALVFNNARIIPVYRDNRIIGTFKTTVNELAENKKVIIFPEHDVKYNNILYEFQDRFVDVARLWHKRTGEALVFVPMYIAPNLKEIHLGEGICYCSDNSPEEERKRICTYLSDAICHTARKLPKHRIVPYRNIAKKAYPYNTDKEVTK